MLIRIHLPMDEPLTEEADQRHSGGGLRNCEGVCYVQCGDIRPTGNIIEEIKFAHRYPSLGVPQRPGSKSSGNGLMA